MSFHTQVQSAVSFKRSGDPFWIGEQSLTWGELRTALARFPDLAEKSGWKPGSRVGLACTGATDTALAFMGLVQQGITAVVLDPAAPPQRLRSIIDASKLSAIILDYEMVVRLRESHTLPADLAILTIEPAAPVKKQGFLNRLMSGSGTTSRPWLACQLDAYVERDAPLVSQDMPAYILFTSGSTSAPKGVVISHRALCAQLDEFKRQWRVGEDSRILNLLPMHHTDGINMGPMLALWGAGSVVRPFTFRIDMLGELFDEVYRQRVTHFISVPSIMALAIDFLNDRPDALLSPEFRHFISTAAYLDPGLWQRFQDKFGVRVSNCYGLTETVSQILYCGPDDDSYRLGTVGRPLNGKVKLVDEGGSLVEHGQVGELCVAGENLMTEYFEDQEATRVTLRDGWLHTGDLATQDIEGFVRIVGRKKNVIITGGINIYPEELDEEARKLANVRDSATVGIADSTWGERAITCVIPAAGQSLEPENVRLELASSLAPEKRPHKVLIFDEFPRTSSGKVAGPQLREIVEERLAQHDLAPQGEFCESQFFEIAGRTFHAATESLSLDDSQDTVNGWDSLSMLEFLLQVENASGHEFSPKEIMSVRTLGDIFSAASTT